MSIIRKCTQVAANGAICQSPALTKNDLCYYHHRDQLRRVVFNQARQLKLSKDFADYPARQELLNPEILEALELPSFDDPAAIQVALSNIARAIMSGHIDTKRAGLILYSLQIAATNIQNVKLKLYPSTDQIAAEDSQPIQPLYPPHSAHFPVPNHPSGERPPKRDADSTLGNLPRNDFHSINLQADPSDPRVIRENLASANPVNANRAKANGAAPDYFPYAGVKENRKHAPRVNNFLGFRKKAPHVCEALVLREARLPRGER